MQKTTQPETLVRQSIRRRKNLNKRPRNFCRKQNEANWQIEWNENATLRRNTKINLKENVKKKILQTNLKPQLKRDNFFPLAFSLSFIPFFSTKKKEARNSITWKQYKLKNKMQRKPHKQKYLKTARKFGGFYKVAVEFTRKKKKNWAK